MDEVERYTETFNVTRYNFQRHKMEIETFRAEIDSLLRTNGYNIISVLLHYKKSGKTIYEIVKEPGFFTRLTHRYTFLRTYPYTSADISIYIGNGGDCIYYKIVPKSRSKDD